MVPMMKVLMVYCVKDVVVGSDVTSVNVAAFSDTLLVITMLTNL